MNRKIRVLHIINTLDIGGAEILLLETVSKMNRQLFENFIIYLIGKGSLRNTLSAPGVRIYDFSREGKFDPLVIFRLMSFMNEIKPDIIHTHGIQSDLIGHLVCLLKNFKNSVTTQHSAFHPKNKSLLYRLARMLTHRSKIIIAVSKYCRHYLIKHLGYDPDLINVIYNGIDLEKFPPKNCYCDSKRHIRIGTLGRLHPQKGIETLIKAINLIKSEVDITCLIPGEGVIEDFLKKMVEDLGLKGIIKFLGPLNPQNKISYLQGLDIFVQPSHWEAFGISILEAMAVGLPIVASDVEGISELIINNKTGILVKPKDERHLADALVILSKNYRLRENFGKNARNFVLQFSVHKTSVMLEETYINIINKSTIKSQLQTSFIK